MRQFAGAGALPWKSMSLLAIRCIFCVLPLFACMEGNAAPSEDRLKEQVSITEGEHPKITSVVLLATKTNTRMNADSMQQILGSLERKFESEHVPLAVYPISSIKFNPAGDGKSGSGHFTYLAAPDYATPALEPGKSPEPSHMLRLTVLGANWIVTNGGYLSADSLIGFSYRIDVAEYSTLKVVYTYTGSVEREEPGEAATRVGRKFFERLQKDGML